MSPASVSKVVSLDEAVALIQPGATLATSGFVGIGTPDGLLDALARAYQAHGRPGGLTLVFAAGQGDGKTRGLNRLAVPGLLRRVVGKIFNDTEIKGWCKEFENKAAASVVA